jgi:O-Antigen ligase
MFVSLTIAFILLSVFLVLPARYKAAVSLIVMTNGFDTAPYVIYGWLTWDYGAALLFITMVHVLLLPKRESPTASYGLFVKLMIGFWMWMLLPLLWSLLVYKYPLYGTLKYSRHMVVGYATFFILLQLYRRDVKALPAILNTLYWVSYALLAVTLLQHLAQKEILYGLYQDYGSTRRFLPIMLPFCLIFVWSALARALSGSRVAWHEAIYFLMVLAVVTVTYTRGIYLTVLGAMFLCLGILALERRLNARALGGLTIALIFGLVAVGATGGLDKAFSRLKSGAELVLAKPKKQFGHDADTFTGRLRLAQERFAMVAERNPVFGFGFLNEDDVPEELRARLRTGSILYSDSLKKAYQNGHPYVLGLHSPDISWGDLALNTGFVGVTLFVAAIVAMLLNYVKVRRPLRRDLVNWRIAFLLQTIVVVLLSLDGNLAVVNVQILCFMLAGYAYTSAIPRQGRRPVAIRFAAAHSDSVVRK